MALLANNICCYADTELMGQMKTWNLNGITGSVYTYDGRLSGQPATTSSDSSSSGNTTPENPDPENP